MIRSTKTEAARLSIFSNSLLIVLKVFAGLFTGSIAILTEALHSVADLMASFVTYISVRFADEPADDSHPYGHAKIENLAAVALGIMILAGASAIVFAAVKRLANGEPLDHLGVGIGVVAFAVAVNAVVSTYLFAQARHNESPALESDAIHLRTDAVTSLAILVGLVLVELTGWEAFDSIAALVVAAFVIWTGVKLLVRSTRVLVDEQLPEVELEAVKEMLASGPPEILGYHKLRTRRAGSRRYVDLHMQFREGTSLEHAHEIAHQMQARIRKALRNSDVLIHLEPEASSKTSQP